MIKNVMITGGSGSLGEYVIAELREKYNCTIYDRMVPEEHRSFPWKTDVPINIGYMDSIGECMRAINVAQADAVVHLAAIPGPTDKFPQGSPGLKMAEEETMRSNVMATYCLMEAMRRLGVKKMVFASSFYTLGLGNRTSGKPFEVDYLPLDEDHPCRPEDTYSLSKVLCEELLKRYARSSDIQSSALRFMGIDGRTARGKGKERKGQMGKERPDFRGGPTPGTTQYVDIRDAALSCRLALEAEGLDPFEAFFIATDDLWIDDVRNVVRRMYPDCAKYADRIDPNDGIISVRRAAKKLGYKPQHSWRPEGSRYGTLAD